MKNWSKQQSEALAAAAAWMRIRHKPWFYLSGYAGTGKTTLAIELASLAKGEVRYAAFTGKAASVMKRKGCRDASTIHSLIYNTEVDEETGETQTWLVDRSALEHVALIIIDECSMVDEVMGQDLLSFGRPVLVLGDPAQLPPVNGGGYFTSQQPDYLLTEVHRQAAESPIIWLATEIRQGKWNRQQINTDGLIITDRKHLNPSDVTGAGIVLVGKNNTRMAYNARLRLRLGHTSELPQKGEPVICLRNDAQNSISNGEIFSVEKFQRGKKSIKLWIRDETRVPFKVDVLPQFFKDDVEASKLPYGTLRGTQQFAWGYAITCHKSQGSQWDNVCVFDESRTFRENADRWLYTAVTRAAENLTLVI